MGVVNGSCPASSASIQCLHFELVIQGYVEHDVGACHAEIWLQVVFLAHEEVSILDLRA